MFETSEEKRLWREAVELFNREAFFECHEALEDLWRPLEPGSHKLFLQGLLQIGVGFHHLEQGNYTGAKNLLSAGLEKLEAVQHDLAYSAPILLVPLIDRAQEALQTVLALGPERLAEFPRDLIPKIEA